MAIRGAPGKLFEILGDAGRENARLGQAFVLFGLLSIVGGVGLFALTETFSFDPDAFLTYRRAAAGLAGYGLPAFLYGLVVVAGGSSRAVEVGVVGVLLSGLSVFAFFLAYPTQWDLATSSTYVIGTLAAYGLGVMLSSFAAGRAMLARLDADDADDADDETGFIWGNSPES